MKKLVSCLVLLSVLWMVIIPSLALAHSGRTDSSGGHNCSAKSISKGLCSGYHYHNGGSSSSDSSSDSNSYIPAKIEKIKLINNETPPYSYCKKVNDNYSSTDAYYVYYNRVWDCNRYTDNGGTYSLLSYDLSVNGSNLSLQKQMVSVQDRAYLYLKDFAAILGLAIEVDKTKNIILSNKNVSLKVLHSNNKIFLNGAYSGYKVVKIEGYSYIPLRDAIKLIGATISINSNEVNVTIK